MKVNIDTVLVGSKVILVPYAAAHVPKYHEWMLDEELRELTASEPLSLEEEYEMQEKWQCDDDKLTFIILSKSDATIAQEELVHPSDLRLSSCPMVGDVNIFLKAKLEDLQRPIQAPEGMEKVEDQVEDPDDDPYAEVEIMIAEQSYRRKGYALEALQLLLGYATGFDFTGHFMDNSAHRESPLKIPPSRLLTRISETNVPSINLFHSLGFNITKRVAVFEEVEMKWKGLPLTRTNERFT